MSGQVKVKSTKSTKTKSLLGGNLPPDPEALARLINSQTDSKTSNTQDLYEKCCNTKMDQRAERTPEEEGEVKYCLNNPDYRTKLKTVNMLIEDELRKPWYLNDPKYWFTEDGRFDVGSYLKISGAHRKIVSSRSRRFAEGGIIEQVNGGFVNPFIYAVGMEMVPVPTRKYKDDVPIEKRIKGPFTPDWQKTTLDNYAQLWNTQCDFGGIAIVTGKASNIFVIDIDKPKDGEVDGLEWLRICQEDYEYSLSQSSDPEDFAKRVGGHFANTMVQQSGGGGYHLIYQYEPIFDLIKNGARDIIKNKEGKTYSIDIKTDKGAINFAPSVHVKTGKKYQLLKEFEGQKTTEYPNFMPGFLIHMLIEAMQNTGYRFINIDKMIYGGMKDGIWQTPEMKLKELERSLPEQFNDDLQDSGIPEIARNIIPDTLASYDKWRSFVFALAYESRKSGDPNKYKRLCIELSKQAPGWNEGTPTVIDQLWDSECPDGVTPCTAGTLRQLMKSGRSKKEYVSLLKSIGLIKTVLPSYNFEDLREIFKDYDVLSDGVEGRKAKIDFIHQVLKGCIIPIVGDLRNGFHYMVKDTKMDHQYNVSTDTYTYVKESVLVNMLKKIPIYNGGWNKKKEEICDTNLANFLVDHGDHTYNKCGFFPFGERERDPMTDTLKDKSVLNTFRGFARRYDPNYVVDKELLKPALDQISAFCDDKPVLIDYFIKWLAHIVQYPSTKTGIAVLVQSEQGAGKSEFINWFGRSVLGGQYFDTCDNIEQVTGKFNSILNNKILIALEEINSYSMDNAVLNKLKELITGRTQNIEHKGIDLEGWTLNFLNLFMGTNKFFPIILECSDRRYFIIFARLLYPVGDPRWINQIAFYNNPKAAINFYHYLMSIETSIMFLKNIPETESKKRLINHSAPLLARFMYEEYCKIKLGQESIFYERNGEIYYPADKLLNEHIHTFCDEQGEKRINAKILKDQAKNVFGVESKRTPSDVNGEYLTERQGGTKKTSYSFNFEALKKKLESLKFDMNPDIDVDDVDDLE